MLKTDGDLYPYKLSRKLIMYRKSSNATERTPYLFKNITLYVLSRNNFTIKLKALRSYLGFVYLITVDVRSA